MLGIGYAALTDTLKIAGTIDLTKDDAEKEFNLDIHFSETVTVDDPTKATGSRNADDDDKGTFSVTGLKKVGEKVSITYTIVNDGEIEATVTPKTLLNTYTDKLIYSTDWDNGEGGYVPKVISAKGSETITITVELKALPTETMQANFTIEFTAVADDNNK
jgi:hypothetical protein